MEEVKNWKAKSEEVKKYVRGKGAIATSVIPILISILVSYQHIANFDTLFYNLNIIPTIKQCITLIHITVQADRIIKKEKKSSSR